MNIWCFRDIDDGRNEGAVVQQPGPAGAVRAGEHGLGDNREVDAEEGEEFEPTNQTSEGEKQTDNLESR